MELSKVVQASITWFGVVKLPQAVELLSYGCRDSQKQVRILVVEDNPDDTDYSNLAAAAKA